MGVSSFDGERILVIDSSLNESDIVVQLDHRTLERYRIETDTLGLFHIGSQDDGSAEFECLNEGIDQESSFCGPSRPDLDVVIIDGESINEVVSIDGADNDRSDLLSADAGVRRVSYMVGEHLQRRKRLVNDCRESKRSELD